MHSMGEDTVLLEAADGEEKRMTVQKKKKFGCLRKNNERK